MKRLLVLLLLLIAVSNLRAQTTLNPLSTTLSASSNDCSIASSCAWQLLPLSAGTTVVTLSGTFSATMTVEVSNNGSSFTTQATLTSAGTTTFQTNGYTHFRVRCSSFTSGSVGVVVSTGTGGGGGGLSIVASLPASCTPGVTQAVQLSTAPYGIYTCTAPNTWTLSGGSSQCGPGCFNVKTYGQIGDAKASKAVTTTNGGSNLVDSTNSPFLATDVGKLVFCTKANTGNALSVTIATISSFTSGSTVSISPATGSANAGANSWCKWFTQKETTAFSAATTAASAALLSTDPNLTSPTLAYPGYLYCPPSGNVLDGPMLTQNAPNGNTNAISFVGSGRNSCIIYVSPDVANTSTGVMIGSVQTDGLILTGFTIDGGAFPFSTPTNPLIKLNVANYHHLYDFNVVNYGSTGDATGVLQIVNSSNGIEENLIMQGGNDHGPMMACNTSNGLLFLGGLYSNGQQANMSFSGCGGRGGNNAPVTVNGTTIDETGGTFPLVLTTGANVNLGGMTIYGGSTGSMSVDATSTAWLNDVNIGQFNSANNVPEAISIASGGVVVVSESTIRANGTGVMVNGPSGGSFVDGGGNQWQTGTGTSFSAITAANYASVGFSGGIVPKATVTHTPNTCYAAGGNLLATAQNLCTMLLDQNYQVLNITAGQVGTAVTTSCATPPVVTISDGTRSTTMTLTSGQQTWSSTGLSTVFASGATLTVSIGTSTCATPPTGVYVNYVLQSVLNP